MGTGASASRQQWTAADEDNTAVEDVRPRTAANANLPTNDMTGMTKLVEAKNKFLKIKSKEKNTACFQKQVSEVYNLRCKNSFMISLTTYLCLNNKKISKGMTYKQQSSTFEQNFRRFTPY